MIDKELPIEFKPREWLGALGDLGTLLPLFIALVAVSGLDAAKSLLFVGSVYIVSALYFRLPMPVQPLKAMSAVLIAQAMPASMLYAGGLAIGWVLLVLAATKSIEWLSRFFTRPIVKGVQFGVGLMLIHAGIKLIANPQWLTSLNAQSAAIPMDAWQFFIVLCVLVLPQLPMTLGNAIFAVSDVAHDYFGPKAHRAQPKQLAISLGLTNVAAGLLGAIPLCHGSGGMTAHYRFGARSPGATLITGALLILFAAIFGNNAYNLIQLIPAWGLGLMIIYVGICHVYLLKGLERERPLALSMGCIALATGNLALALIAGLIVSAALKKLSGASYAR